MAGILSVGTSALVAYRRALDTIGHNISNANTPGYSRQTVQLSTNSANVSGNGFAGTGVQVSAVTRQYDSFLTSQLRNTSSSTAQFETYHDYSSQLDNLLADENLGLDSEVQSFFNSVQDLAGNPASLLSREMLLSDSQSMVDRFSFIDAQLNESRESLNQDIKTTVTEINALATSLAEANSNIARAYEVSSGAPPNDLLDQRDQLLKELSELVALSAVEQGNGALNVFIGSGQPLVFDATASSLAVVPGALDSNDKDIVYSNSSSSMVITSQMTGGRLGGLLDVRDEVLNPAQNELGRIAVSMASQFNAQHRLGVDLAGTMGRDFFTAPSPSVQAGNNAGTAAVSAAYGNIADLTVSDYTLVNNSGGTDYTLKRLSDNTSFIVDTTIPASLTVDGFTLSISGGAALAGDSFLIEPTRDAAGTIALAINDANTIAAAEPPLSADAATTNTGNGAVTQLAVTASTGLPLSDNAGDITLTFDPDAGGGGVGFEIPGFVVVGAPTPLLYDPAADSGNTLALTVGGASITMSGTPASGDSFVITDNISGVGDNRNALALAAIQQSSIMMGGTATLQQSYAQLVSGVGADTMRADINMQSHQGLLDQAVAARESISGVNLDEEAANLIRFQQAYQAAAQMINVSRTLFDTLLAATGR